MLSFSSLDVLGEILDLIELVSEGFPTYSSIVLNKSFQIVLHYHIWKKHNLCINLDRLIKRRSVICCFCFYAPVTIVSGHYDLPLSVCLSVRPFVTLHGIEFV